MRVGLFILALLLAGTGSAGMEQRLLTRYADRLPQGMEFSFCEDPVGTSPEAYSVSVVKGRLTITSSTLRGRIYGLGRVLRENGFRGVSAPKMSVRGVIVAPQSESWYDAAEDGDLRAYVEDLALWGCNALRVMPEVRRFNGPKDSAYEAEVRRLKVLLKAASDCGLQISLHGNADEIRRSGVLDRFADLRFTQFGASVTSTSGLWEMLPELAGLVEEKVPGCRLELDVGAFGQDGGGTNDWATLFAQGERLRSFVDGLSVMDAEPVAKGAPANLPVTALIEIGARPMGLALATAVRKCPPTLSGFRVKSVDADDDLNKVIFLQTAWNPDRAWQEAACDYAVFHFGAAAREAVVAEAEALENSPSHEQDERAQRYLVAVEDALPSEVRTAWRWKALRGAVALSTVQETKPQSPKKEDK